MAYLRKHIASNEAEMLAATEFSRSQWGNYETGASRPNLLDFIAIAKYFGISETDLLHTDLEATGNLIEKGNGAKKPADSNLKGNGKRNLIGQNAQNQDALSVVNEPAEGKILHLRMPKVITVDTQGNENVVMVPVKARAGYLNGYGDPKFISKLPAYRLPGLNNGTFRIFEVEGLSMYPTLNSGDNVIGSYVEQLRDVRDDRVYVVVTKNEGVVVKRVLNRLERDGKLILKSDNIKHRDDYPTIVCDPSDILEIWYAIGFISRQMRPPSEMYNRLIDLEARITLMEHQKLK